MFKAKKPKATKATCRPRMARSVEPRLKRQKVKKKPGAEKARKEALGLAGKAALRLAGLCMLAAVVTAGLLAGYTALACNKRFRVQRAEVVGTRHLSRWEILKAAGVGSQDSLVSLSVGKIQHRVSRLPWVKKAEVHRDFPGTVRIEVVEREASALALIEGRLFLLDRDLEAFTPVRANRAPDRPVLTGLGMGDVKNPDAEMRELFGLAETVMAQLSPADRRNLSEIHLDRVWGLELVFNGMPAVVRLGREGFASRLARLAKIKKDLAARGELGRALIIDLLAEHKAVVRLGEESA